MASFPIKIVSSITLQSSIEKTTSFYKDAATNLPKVLPHRIKEIIPLQEVGNQIKKYKIIYQNGLPLEWAQVDVDLTDSNDLIRVHTINVLTSGNAGDFNTRGTRIRIITVFRPQGKGTNAEVTYEFERNNQDIGPALLEFDISNFIAVDSKIN